MGKKAVIGTSPKDTSIDKMDRHIQRNEQREKQNLKRLCKKDLSKVPFNEWPLKKQLAYMETRSESEKFKERYASYSTWYDAVKKQSGVYPGTFVDWTSRTDTRDAMRDMYSRCVSVKSALDILKREHGIY